MTKVKKFLEVNELIETIKAKGIKNRCRLFITKTMAEVR